MVYVPFSLALFAISAIASPSAPAPYSISLAKRDPSAVAATRAFQNCVLRDRDFYKKVKGGDAFCNQGIQMAECHVNSRVMNQVFAVFMPGGGDPYQGEGGWYGECCAYNIYPEADLIGEIANANYACFTWEGEDKKQGNGPPPMPKTLMIPYPVICPSNLDPCYSLDWFEDAQSKMPKDEKNIPTFTGVWGSPKAKFADGQNHWLWCKHRCGGCKMGNWHQMQTDHIAELGCKYEDCIPYHGNVQHVGQLKIQPVGTYPALNSYDVCADYKNATRGSGQQSGGKGSSSGQGQIGSGSGKGNNGQNGSGKGNDNGNGHKGAGSGSGSGNGQHKGENQGGNGSSSGSNGQNGKQAHKGKGHHKDHGKGGNGSKRDCEDSEHKTHHKHKDGQAGEHHQHKPQDKEHCKDGPKNTSTEPTKREDSLMPVYRRHHIKEQRRHNSIF